MSTTIYINRAAPILDAATASVAPGDTVCSASNSGVTTTVNKAVSANIGNAKAILGVVLAAATSGDAVALAYPGDLVSNSVTGLGPGTVSFVTVNLTNSHLQRATVLDGGEYIVGICDTFGNLTVCEEPGIVSSTGSNFVLNVKRFGATGDNVTDDTTAIQNAIMACQNSLQSGAVGGLTGIYSGFTIFFPRGSYKVSGIDVNEFMNLEGDHNAIIWGSSSARSTILIGCGYASISNLTIVGGKWCVQITGTSTAFGGYLGTKEPFSPGLTIRNCSLRCNTSNVTDVLIYMGGLDVQNRQIGGQVLVENCDMQGPAFFWGGGDQITFRDCFVTQFYPDAANPPRDQNTSLPLSMWTSGGVLTLENVALSPNAGVQNTNVAIIEGVGHFRIVNSRFGGESLCILARCCRTNKYNGFDMPNDPPVGVNGATFFFDKTGISCTTRTHLFEAYDMWPQKLIFEDCLISIPGLDQYDPVDVNVLCGPIWVGPDVDLTKIRDRGMAYETRLNFINNNVAHSVFQSSIANRLDMTTYTDITEQLWPYFRSSTSDSPITHKTGLTESLSKNNLWFQGHFDWNTSASGTNTGFAGAGTETSTGYALTKLQASTASYFSLNGGADSSTQINYVFNGGGGTAGQWGDNLEIGQYMFSCYCWATKTVNLQFYLNYLGTGRAHFERSFVIPGTSTYRRISFPFYWDGDAGKKPQFGVITGNFFPAGTTIAVGLFMINKGNDLAPYIFPGYDPTIGPAVNLTSTEYVPCTYYGTSAPANGTYKKGDITINTNPTAGGTYAWVCTTAGSPGTHRAIAIA